MNDRKLARKITNDADKVKRDVSTLVGDGAVQLGRFGDDVSHATDKAREDLTSWAEDGASRVSNRVGKLIGDATDAAGRVAATVKKDFGDGFNQYNAKAREAANKVSDGIGEKVTRYPWVAISIGLAVGLLVGGLFRPGRKLLS